MSPAARARRLAYLELRNAAHVPIARFERTLARELATLSAAEITRARLGRMLVHAVRNVPFYRDVLVRTYADPYTTLARAPLLTHGMLRSQFYELLSDDLDERRWHEEASGNSTGDPVRFVQDDEHSAAVIATVEYFHELLGRRIGEPVELVWGSERDVNDGSAGLQKRVLNWLSGEHWTNAFALDEADVDGLLDRLSRRPPKLIVAYAQSIYEVARAAERMGRDVPPQRAVITSAGTLYDFMRETIERVFGCSVYNQYGSRETGPIAIECDYHDGLHVAPWAAYVEIMDESGFPLPPGTAGQIVVTSLTNAAMPLIRYAIGDHGALMPTGRCACGRAGQRLAFVSGRSGDVFRTRTGDLVDAEFLTHLLSHRDWIERFQVVQKDYGRLLFRIVPAGGGEMPADQLEEIRAGARAALGPDCSVEFERARSLRFAGTGKFRYTVSEVGNTS